MVKIVYVFDEFFFTLNISTHPSGTGQTNLWMPQGVLGQVMIGGEQGYVVRWDYSYSSWTLFTCEVEMLLHVVSTAGARLSLLIFIYCNKNIICYIIYMWIVSSFETFHIYDGISNKMLSLVFFNVILKSQDNFKNIWAL